MGQLIPFDNAGAAPAHILKAFGDPSVNGDLTGGVSAGYPSISIKGKAWHIVQGGTRTLITNDDGEPRASIEVVIVKANPHVSKVYYANGYTEGSDEKPTCYSDDGVAPDAGCAEPQSNKCAICPHNQWGSRVTENGAKGKECADSRRLAVAPAGDPESPMLLRVPAGSLRELVSYADMLNRRRAPYQAVVTKIGFDHTVAHQKLTFKAVRWLDEAEVEAVAETMASPIVESIIGGASGSYAALPAPDDIEGERPSNVAAVTETPKATGRKPKPAVVQAEVAAALADPEPDPPSKPAVSTKGFGSSTPKVVASEPKPDPAPVKANNKLLDDANASLDDILASLDD